jgi:hypothetical protein
MMKAKPVKGRREPAYPTRAELLAREGLLESYLPRGWRAGRRLAGTVTLLAAANLTGCGDTPGTPPVQKPIGAQTVLGQPAPAGPTVSSEAVAVVAPIFNHGEGRGATGCIVMSPPVFLSEEEAMQVIRAELREHGIELGDGVAFEGLTVMPRVEPPDEDLGPSSFLEERGKTPQSLSMDAVDEVNQVAVKFISRKDCGRLDVPAYFSSVTTYDAKGLARHVAGQIKERGTEHVYAGVFYDPLVGLDFAQRAREIAEQERSPFAEPLPEEEPPAKPGAAKSKELLRRQARDFVAWLEQQGVL